MVTQLAALATADLPGRLLVGLLFLVCGLGLGYLLGKRQR